MNDGYARRRALMQVLCQRLELVCGERVEVKELGYDESLKCWVWPKHGVPRLVDGWWITDALRVYLYDERKTLWYVSQVTETLNAYTRVYPSKRVADEIAAEHQRVLALYDPRFASSETVDPANEDDQWSWRDL
nr:MAG: hypothetical protein [Microvirus sp.]